MTRTNAAQPDGQTHHATEAPPARGLWKSEPLLSAIPLGWDKDPGATDLIFDGAVVLSAPLWLPCWLAGWLLSLPARAVRRYRGTR